MTSLTKCKLMKTKIIGLAAIVLAMVGCGTKKVSSPPENNETMSEQKGSVYDFKMTAIDGSEIDLSTYKGKNILIVNTASECGFTPQYEGLQKLHEAHGNDVAILGFPANNFGGQEPGSDADIQKFCKVNYGVTFQMFSKISVKGDDMHPLYQWLSDASQNGWNSDAPSWNFCKYLIDEEGKLVKFYGSAIDPMSDEIVNELI